MNKKHPSGKGIFWSAMALVLGLGPLHVGAQATYTWQTNNGNMTEAVNWGGTLPINGNIGEVGGGGSAITARFDGNLYSGPDTAPDELRVLSNGTIEINISTDITENHNVVLDGGTFQGQTDNNSYYRGSVYVKSNSVLGNMQLRGTLANYDGTTTGTLTKVGGARLHLGGDNSAFTGGFLLENGSLDVENTNGLGLGTLEFAENANNKDLNLGGYNTTVTRLSGNPGTGSVLIKNNPWDIISGTPSYTDATLTVDQDADTTYGGTFEDAEFDRDLSLVKTGTGTLTLTGDSSSWGLKDTPGSKTINGGTLVVGHANALGLGGVNTVNAGGTLAIAGGITFTQSVTFDAGSTLGGNGTYDPSGSLTVGDGMTVAPGMSIGTLTLDSDVTFADGGILDIELGNGTGDLLVVNGALTVSTAGVNGTTLNLTGDYSDAPILTFTSGGAEFDLITYNGVDYTWEAAQESQSLGGEYHLAIDGNSIYVIPEPSTLTMFLLSALCWHLLRRRRA